MLEETAAGIEDVAAVGEMIASELVEGYLVATAPA